MTNFPYDDLDTASVNGQACWQEQMCESNLLILQQGSE
jgi:hypothetical protein